MTISSSLLVDRTQQIQLTDNAGRAQGEVFTNQLNNLVLADFAGAEGFNKNGNRPGYDLMAEGRYYLTPNFAIGAQYDYLRSARLPDKMHLHFIRPEMLLRILWSDGNQGVFFSLGIGYMNYQERLYKRNQRQGHLYRKGYCGISFALGYEFRITRKLSGMLRADMLTADWFVNPAGRLYNTDGYDDGVNHNWFKNNITFFNLGLAVQFGR